MRGLTVKMTWDYIIQADKWNCSWTVLIVGIAMHEYCSDVSSKEPLAGESSGGPQKAQT